MIVIKDRLLRNNRTRRQLSPVRGLVIHSTANPEATARANANYFDSPTAGGTAHLVVDWDEALTCVPWKVGTAEVANHCMPSGNARFLGMEICETHDPNKFNMVWKNAVEVTAQVLSAYQQDSDFLISHAMVSRLWYETDHVDPVPFFTRMGRSWGQFIADVDMCLEKGPQGKTIPIVMPSGQRLYGYLRGERTYVRVANAEVPVRIWAETLGLIVTWNPDTSTVVLAFPEGV